MEKSLFNTLKYIEIETASGCNRACKWCLFGQYPNFRPAQLQFLDKDIIIKIFNDLSAISYQGIIAFYSINEPLLDDRICSGELFRHCKEILGNNVIIELMTNGDNLTASCLSKMFASGLDSLLITAYEKDNYNTYKNVFANSDNIRILDHSCFNEGYYYSNRAGSISDSLNSQKRYKNCLFPYYKTVIGWDGELRICYNDILQNIKVGNVYKDSLLSILNSEKFIKIRDQLKTNREAISPCNQCNRHYYKSYFEKSNKITKKKLILKNPQ